MSCYILAEDTLPSSLGNAFVGLMRNNGEIVVCLLENDTFPVITTWKLVGEPVVWLKFCDTKLSISHYIFSSPSMCIKWTMNLYDTRIKTVLIVFPPFSTPATFGTTRSQEVDVSCGALQEWTHSAGISTLWSMQADREPSGSCLVAFFLS